MIEKLLENWLDSASERSYQAVFVQMLSAQGYRVVHSTRHTAMEFGKDVLAVSPDGQGCAYQLKGTPGGRLGLREFRSDIQDQLVQLMSMAIVFPGFPEGPHKSFLVNNGYFQEEVQRSADDLNRMPYPSKLTLIARGDLLSWCKEFGTALWPSELRDTRALLELFLSDPSDILPTEKLSQLLLQILAIDPSEKSPTKPEFERLVTSAALLTGIATSPFAERENHFAVVSAWTLFVITTIAAGERHGLILQGQVEQSLQLAERTIGDTLVQLWEEVKVRPNLVEGNPLAEPEVYGWRTVTLLGLLSCLSFIDDSSPCLTEASREELSTWLIDPSQKIQVWGESAVAHLAPWLVWLRKHDATIRPDIKIAEIFDAIVTSNQPRSPIAIPNPYYRFQEIFRTRSGLHPANSPSFSTEEAFAGNAYTAEALFHLLVRTNLKQRCKALWGKFSKVAHHVCINDFVWQYCTLTMKTGIDETRIYPRTYVWADLQREAVVPRGGVIPTELISRPWLLGLWWQIAPYRFTTEASRVFVNGTLPGWGT